MSLQTPTMSIPLYANSNKTLCVGGTRVSLDTVVAAFNEGATAEEIVQQYPTLKLADVYCVLGYYLEHQLEVAEYIQQRESVAQDIRDENEARFDPSGIRARLLARREK